MNSACRKMTLLAWFADGPGGWGAGVVSAALGTTIVILHGLVPLLDPTGATAVVVQGPGSGQYRAVTARLNATALELSSPFDGHVEYGASVVAIVASAGGRLVTGKFFGCVFYAVDTSVVTMHRQLFYVGLGRSAIWDNPDECVCRQYAGQPGNVNSVRCIGWFGAFKVTTSRTMTMRMEEA